MDQPPAQDSTKHILNVLNDDCIEEIFRRIFCLEDFLNMAEVCQRFQQNAKNCFRTQFKYVFLRRYRNGGYDIGMESEKFRNRCVPFDRAIPFLNTFGSFIHKLEWSTAGQNSSNQERNDDIFKSIVKFTSKTLKELYISYYRADFAQTQFLSLEYLRLWRTSPNFEYFPPLKVLKIESIEPTECHSFMRTIPRLEWFYLSLSDVKDDIVVEFLSLNPQLQRLTLLHCIELSPLILKAIVENSTNLVELCLDSLYFNRTPDLFNTNLQYLGALGQLKHFEIDLNSTILFKTIINTFAENEVPIETMKIHLCDENPNIDSSYQLLTIRTLKYLDFMIFPKNCFNELMVTILKTQTELESIKMFCSDDPSEDETLPMLEIKNVLPYGKNLSEFECHVVQLGVNLESYESVLCLVKNRIRTKIIIGHVSSKCIPDDVLAKNEHEFEWLDVRYVRMNDTEPRIYFPNPNEMNV
ncbi:uncharacterized protein LOC129575967 [Sitodiplosis mosellana]|uniref:uncharacterized protein LOC129575967 n=1 Tax=Sitodiplosis mosellana TaxID=263140 RepID=UPI0024441049|nr:uncharacterized protein LOC129575967 [Sitodiplosis mosellana]XP_055316219.1 uncharacterized protein LOC129575967 [Sitodiplosis mosellana]